MDAHTAPRPTGRRTLTPAKLAALDHPPPRPGGPGKCEVAAAFRRAAPALDATRLLPLVDLLLSRSFPQDWTGETRPMVWVSNQWLCAHLGVGESRLKQMVGAAFERGFIAMRESGNGHRGGGREGGEDGRILWAYGFDLSPLAARRDEFRDLAGAWERHEAAVRRSRADLSGLRRAVLTLADLGRATAPGAADWADIAGRARQIAGRGRNQRDADVLRMLADQLAAMRDEARAVLDAAPSGSRGDPPDGTERPSGSPSGDPAPSGTDRSAMAFSAKRPHDAGTAKSGPTGSVEWPLNTTATQQESTKEDTKVDEQMQSRPGPSTPPPPAEPADVGKAGASPVLGDFPATPAFVLTIAPSFRTFAAGGKPTREQVIEAAWHVRGHFGISQALWGQACQTFGRWEAAVALAAVVGRHAAGQVRSPGGLLCKMLDLHGRGELRLDRTLRGLAARLAASAGGAGGDPVRSPVGPQAPSSLFPRVPPVPETSDAADGAGASMPQPTRKSFDQRVREALDRARRHTAEAAPGGPLHGGPGSISRTSPDSGRRGTIEGRS